VKNTEKLRGERRGVKKKKRRGKSKGEMVRMEMEMEMKFTRIAYGN
jgi:hypothetical protein